MATVTIDEDALRIEIHSLDRLWTFTSSMTIPLAHVRGATADPGIAREPKGFRAPGTHIPGVVAAGTFRKNGEQVFWDVHDPAKALVIQLEDEKYQRPVIEVDDPHATADLIERALAGARPANS